ncbi:probable GPI-anchored wall transfer protein 1 [Rhynchosporium agropyri]|uniref:GPI-anchored wall transfer protein n=1 Tax=Rhynchosporium agropyri TaxID=914238 RepID=A0A1E1KUH4_9HELO|nr:probable GPI-anchored wall transfer protein 1 [Rhynchosporium agropyri]
MSRAAEQAMAASYKSLKEDFVSNLTGGEIGEINYVTAVAPAAVILWSALQTRQSFFKPYTPLAFAVDFLLNVCAILVAITLYAPTPLLLNAILLAPVPGLYLLPGPPAPKKAKLPPSASSKQSKPETLNSLPKRAFVTTYRGAMIVVTCIAILAVDFRIFPRRFAKVENWGTSLMDVGVGSFVFSAGIVAARPILKAQLVGEKLAPLTERISRSLRHSLPLIVLGLIRLYTVKGLDYAEHVTEYGVHWNFFFTMGFLPPFVALFQSAFEYVPSYAGLAVALGVAYQAALEFTDLKAFVLTAPRTNLFDKNREGIFSFFGYLAIFLAGQQLGLLVLPRGEGKTGGEQRKRLLLKLGVWSVGWIALFWFSTNYTYGLSLAVSRRLANLPYFLWIAAFNTTQLMAFCLAETILLPNAHKIYATKKEEDEVYQVSTSRVLEAFNRNGLAVFLVANLLTGLVNLTVPTLHVTSLQAMGILVAYAATVTGVAIGLDIYDISIKM